jgi:hypothetical protein
VTDGLAGYLLENRWPARGRRRLSKMPGPYSISSVIGENDTMNAQTLPKVKMPNRDGFIVRFPDAM